MKTHNSCPGSRLKNIKKNYKIFGGKSLENINRNLVKLQVTKYFCQENIESKNILFQKRSPKSILIFNLCEVDNDIAHLK